MLRKLALSLLLVPSLGVPQNPAVEKSRGKALDAAAATPFYTKKGADALKRVMAGGDDRKRDEQATDPLDGKPTIVPAGKSLPAGPAAAAKGQNPGEPQLQAQPAAPAVEPVFAWRLVGISYGRQKGMALFQADGKTISAHDGATLDPETKVVSVTRSRVVLVFHGKRLELTPW
jgi:hypothetical protein